MRWIGSRTGTPANIKIGREGTSETFGANTLVIWDRSEDGIVAVPTSSGVPSAQAFYAITLEAATGTAGTELDILIPTPDDLFIASLASAEDTFVAPDADNYGIPYGLILTDTSNSSVYAVDEGNTSNTWVVLEEIYQGDIVKRGGTPGSLPTMSVGDRVIFRFLNSVLDTSGSQA
jgi:hypothetical protein